MFQRTMDTDDALEEFKIIMAESSLHKALGFLNARALHRFTGIYRFDPPMLWNILLFDRQNPDLEVGGDAPLRETYCSIVGDTKGAFSTADALRDESLREHPAINSVMSYCGAPLGADDAEPFGTLCHFDFAPRPIPQTEIPLLKEAARLITAKLRQETVKAA